ncbi:type IV secretory system conjugative DNA transfer family protein [Tolypothrix sp. VBCCA 56010]|uniref:type IV secretory system conjugative DNA transfer family protein n=1 Tax=Tolypothrix sp. VBCCA 56010 TaxID=3137731 RepID=UPI003D7EB805
MNLKTKYRILYDDIEKTFDSFSPNLWATAGVLSVWTIFILVWTHNQKLPTPQQNPSSYDIEIFCVVVLIIAIIIGIQCFMDELGSDALILAIWLSIGLLIIFCQPTENHNQLQAFVDGARNNWRMAVIFASVYWFCQNWYTLHFVFLGDRLIRQYWGLFLVQILMYSVLYGVHFILAVPVVLVVPRHFFRKWLIGKHDGDTVVRGTVILTDVQANRPYRQMLRENPEPTLLFGNLNIPLDEATTHFLIAGGTGSGKTLNLRLLLQDVVKVLNSGIGRMIIYDATRQTLPLLQGMRLSTPVYILNPFDQRCVAWDISQDCTAPADAEALAYSLILEPMANDKGDSFWKNCAWLLFKGIIEFYMLNAPCKWTLRDIILAFSNENTLVALLRSDLRTSHYLDESLEKTDKTLAGVIQTIRAQTGQLQILAALWEKASARRRISIKDFMSQNAVIVLGRDERAKVTLNAVNNLLLSQFTQLLMNQPSQAKGGNAENFVVIDELGNFHMNCLEQLATEGRGRSVCLIAAVQDVLQLKVAYGANQAEIIAGQFTHKALLRFTIPESQEWASRLIGDVELRRTTSNWDWNSALFGLIGWGTKTALGETITTVKAVQASEFESQLPAISAKLKIGLSGFYVARHIHKHTYPLATLKHLLIPPDESCPGVIPTPDEWQWLQPWAEADYHRLKIHSVMLKLQQQKYLQKLQQSYQKPETTNPPDTTEEEEFAWERSLAETEEESSEEEEIQSGNSNVQNGGGFAPKPSNGVSSNTHKKRQARLAALRSRNAKRQSKQQQRKPPER